MNRPKTLSAAFVRTVKEPGRYGDGRGGHGLSLLVKPASGGRLSKSWAQRLRVNGKPVNVGLGAYPVVSLSEARQAALENRQAAAQGRDPRGGGVPTFERAIEEVLKIHRAGWKDGGKTEKQWQSSLETYAMPRLGRKRVDAITTADVLGVLTPIWHAKPETARRTRRRISATMKWAVAQGHREDDPAGDALGAALPKQNGHRTGYRALPHGEVGAALANVRQSDAWPAAKLALELVALTACRSGEVRLATWDEFDLERRVWTIPAERTKSARAHAVPLSNAALAVLEQARELADGSGRLFSSPTGRALTDRVLSQLLRDLGVDGTVHGLRASFRSWCAKVAIRREVAEAALGHVVGGVEASYQRSDLLEARREVMGRWALHVAA